MDKEAVAEGSTDAAKAPSEVIDMASEKLPPLIKKPENHGDVAPEEEEKKENENTTDQQQENTPKDAVLNGDILKGLPNQITDAIFSDANEAEKQITPEPQETNNDDPENTDLKSKQTCAEEDKNEPAEEPKPEEGEQEEPTEQTASEEAKEETTDEQKPEEVKQEEQTEQISHEGAKDEAATEQASLEQEEQKPEEGKDEPAEQTPHEEIKDKAGEEDKKEDPIASDVANTLNAIVKKVAEEEEKNEPEQTGPTESNLDESNGDLLITAVDDAASRPEADPEPADEPEPEPEEEPEQDEEPDVPPIPVAKYSDDELQEALKKMLKKKILPEVEMRPSVIDYAKKQSLCQLMNEEYDQAARIDEAVELMVASLHTDESAYDCEQQTLTLKQKLEDAQAQNKQIQEEFAERIAQFKEMENQRLEKLQEQHEIDRQAFEADWSRPEALIQFNKPSSALLQLRRQQKSFAISHHFDQAKQLKIAGDQMQREEAAHASRRAAETMRNAYAKLLEKQDKEIQCFMENGYRKLQALETERDRRLKANENLRNQLDLRIRGPKQPRRPTVTIPQVQSRSESRTSVPGVISFRTRSQFAGYKKATEKTRLDVKIGDVQKITKPMTPSPRKGQRKPIRFV